MTEQYSREQFLIKTVKDVNHQFYKIDFNIHSQANNIVMETAKKLQEESHFKDTISYFEIVEAARISWRHTGFSIPNWEWVTHHRGLSNTHKVTLYVHQSKLLRCLEGLKLHARSLMNIHASTESDLPIDITTCYTYRVPVPRLLK